MKNDNGCFVLFALLVFTVAVLACAVVFYGTLAYVLLWVLSHFVHVSGFSR